MKRAYLVYIAILSFVLLCNPLPSKGVASSTSETLKDILADGADEASLCSSVKRAMGKGLNTKDIVRVAVEMGHNACLVIKCGVMAGGNPEDVINGVTDAGITSDVVARCCVDAGVRAGEVATDLARVCYGLGYSEPAQTLTMPDIPADPPVISPHTF
jgi:hypothetical protein